jgi:PPE-repeat protein
VHRGRAGHRHPLAGGLTGQALIGQALIGQALIGQALIGQALIGQALIGQALIGQALIGQACRAIARPGRPVHAGRNSMPSSNGTIHPV